MEFELTEGAFNEITYESRSNRKCDRYVSWKKDLESEAFTLSWAQVIFNAFSPFNLVLKTSCKIK